MVCGAAVLLKSQEQKQLTLLLMRRYPWRFFGSADEVGGIDHFIKELMLMREGEISKAIVAQEGPAQVAINKLFEFGFCQMIRNAF